MRRLVHHVVSGARLRHTPASRRAPGTRRRAGRTPRCARRQSLRAGNSALHLRGGRRREDVAREGIRPWRLTDEPGCLSVPATHSRRRVRLAHFSTSPSKEHPLRPGTPGRVAFRGVRGARGAPRGRADDPRDRGHPLGGRGDPRCATPPRATGRRCSPPSLSWTHRDDQLGPAHPVRILLGTRRPPREARRLHLDALPADGIAQLALGHAVDPVELHPRANGRKPVLRDGSTRLRKHVTVPTTVLGDAVPGRTAVLSQSEIGVLEVIALAPPLG